MGWLERSQLCLHREHVVATERCLHPIERPLDHRIIPWFKQSSRWKYNPTYQQLWNHNHQLYTDIWLVTQVIHIYIYTLHITYILFYTYYILYIIHIILYNIIYTYVIYLFVKPLENKSLGSQVQEIFSTGFAFAALRRDATVVTWGDPFHGGDSSASGSVPLRRPVVGCIPYPW